MKTFYRIILTISFLANVQLFSWDSTAAKYMPLQTGNVWVYFSESRSYPYPPSYAYTKYVVTGIADTLEKRYFRIQRTTYIITGTGGCGFLPALMRLDSASMNLYSAESSCNSNERIIDSLPSGKNDTAARCYYSYRICIDTSLRTVFNASFPSKEFTTERGNSRTVYIRGLGIKNFGWAELMNWCYDTLKGCVINGVLYGDTSTFVGINQISSEVPNYYSLSQNYPNPFNPSTYIKFQIPKSEFVKLIIFDVLGKEIQTLVNQQLSPGTYSADFDGSSLPSGVYYYRIETNSFTQTKKMILIK